MKKIAIKVELASGILVQGASLILQAGLGITIFIGTVLITGGKIELLPLLVLLMFSTQIYGPILAILSNLLTITSESTANEYASGDLIPSIAPPLVSSMAPNAPPVAA